MTRWTVLVYIAGDNDLDLAGVGDLKEMLAVGTGPRVRVAVQLDRYRNAKTRRWIIPERGGLSFSEWTKQAEEVPEPNTGDAQALADFLIWGSKTYPADRLALVVWNHGYGWVPGSVEKRGPGRGGLFRPGPVSLGAVPKGIAQDWTSDDSLDTLELEGALSKGLEPGGSLDLVGMDACLMAQLEVLFELRHLTTAFVGSVQDEPGEGWPYRMILRELRRGAERRDGLLPVALAVSIARSYITHWRQFQDEDDGNTQSAVRSSVLQDVARAASLLGRVLRKRLMAGQDAAILSAVDKVQKYDNPHYADLGDLAKRVIKSVPVAEVREVGESVLTSLRRAVAYNGRVGVGVGRSTGLTVYLPRSQEELSTYRASYAKLTFHKEHPEWLAFLDALVRSRPEDPR